MILQQSYLCFCISKITLDPPVIYRTPRDSGLPLTIFTQGCDFNCFYCPVPQLIPKCDHPIISTERIFQILSSSKFISQLFIIGGEPTLQHCLLEFCGCVKSISQKIYITLVTIGTRPSVLQELIQSKYIDCIVLSLKMPLIKEKYEEFTRTKVEISHISTTIELLKNATTIDTRFITTQTPLHTPQDIEQMKSLVRDLEVYPLPELLV